MIESALCDVASRHVILWQPAFLGSLPKTRQKGKGNSSPNRTLKLGDFKEVERHPWQKQYHAICLKHLRGRRS